MFFALHDVRGKRQAHRRTVNLGLAAALMGELILHHQVTIDVNGLVHKRHGLPDDRVAAGINALIQQQPHSSSLKDWLRYVATQDLEGHSVYDHVGRRLTDQQLVVSERDILRRTRYVPISSNVSGWAWSRVSDSLRRIRQSGDPSQRLIPREALFGNLLLATDLHRHVILADGFNVEAELRKQLDLTPPAVQRLVHTTEIVVGNSAITSA
ncbi:GPP34 family phosphoprotein [Actinoplanes sp. NBRC 103695]|uniref:GOLPH3/VPS74 family protein n=1 Tax=Actinoplanes sp. NBRC 103695 TaxID=3032202 RepID=UPI002552B0DE|nr:GPP34 family phosphoprotein [Actinoplanes sp. NBRC 103695]